MLRTLSLGKGQKQLTLSNCFLHLSPCVAKSIKVDLENKETRPVPGKTGFSRVVFSHSLFWLIPIWSMESCHVYLLSLAFKTHVRGSPRQGTLCYSSGHQWPTEVVQTPCLGVLFVFHVNQVIQPLFSTNFPTTLFFPNLSLYL